MPTETAPPPESTALLNSLLSSSCSPNSNYHSINVTSSDPTIHSNGSSYIVNMAHVTYQCIKLHPIPLDHLLMDEPTVVWLVLMSTWLNTLNNMQILQE